LDLLSSGRFELGIGPTDTNAWDAIEDMGGVRRMPAESVRALSEAIDIIRGIWDVFAPGMMRIEGKHYRVSGTNARAPASQQYLNPDARRTAAHSATGRTQGRWLDFGASVDD
jgi:alkanesulfonate monooxygenase SsuD/methylene tetrahydromethanopterin reductase-like flavin-dependent oxidoreductase (luciferase family)